MSSYVQHTALYGGTDKTRMLKLRDHSNKDTYGQYDDDGVDSGDGAGEFDGLGGGSGGDVRAFNGTSKVGRPAATACAETTHTHVAPRRRYAVDTSRPMLFPRTPLDRFVYPPSWAKRRVPSPS